MPLLVLLNQAASMMQAEYDYLNSLLTNPFLSPADRISIASTCARLQMDIANVKEKAEEVRASIAGGVFKSVDDALIQELMQATEALGKKLRAAAKVQAVLAATAGFLGVIGQLMNPPAPAGG